MRLQNAVVGYDCKLIVRCKTYVEIEYLAGIRRATLTFFGTGFVFIYGIVSGVGRRIFATMIFAAGFCLMRNSHDEARDATFRLAKMRELQPYLPYRHGEYQ
jgi:hypothetical protein